MRSPAAVLLESYVLDTIGALSDERAKQASRVVQRVFDREPGNWRAGLREEFGLAPGTDDQLRAMWLQARAVASRQQSDITPDQFAAMVVEENFSDAVEMVGTEMLVDLE